MIYKEPRYRICSCGKMLKYSNRSGIIFHRQMGHNVPMKTYTKEEIIKIKGDIDQ